MVLSNFQDVSPSKILSIIKAIDGILDLNTLQLNKVTLKDIFSDQLLQECRLKKDTLIVELQIKGFNYENGRISKL